MCNERYVNPFTDFGFKLLFGTPANKEFLIFILNSLFDGEQEIVDISYNNTEIFGKSPDDRRAVYDLYCETSSGSHIIVEMQNAYQRYFFDRTVYYSSFPIQAAAGKGEWNYRLPPIYVVAFLNFRMPQYVDNPGFKHVAQLMDRETHQVTYDKLTYIYLEMPKFNKEIDDLRGGDDCWLYIIKNLALLDEKPSAFRDKIFERFFRVAEIARFSPEQRFAYEASLKSMRDYNNTIISAEEIGVEKGMRKGIEIGEERGIKKGIEIGEERGVERGAKSKAMNIARKLKAGGVSPIEIERITELSQEEISSL